MGVYPFYLSNFITGDINVTSKKKLGIKSNEDLITKYQSINTNKDSYINPIDNKEYSKTITEDILLPSKYLQIDDSLNYQNTLTGLLEDYNLILVHLESLNQFLVELDLIFDERMTFLKSLFEESFVFENFYTNVGMGVSADAEVSVLAGLYPNGSSSLYWDIEKTTYNFDTIPKYFNQKGYATQAIHGDKAHFYNRENAYLKDNVIGFNKEYYDITYF